ncbi:hypothetical protein L249_2802 [Ophiocordyceps polyrhachis-furcata BCC 54312]|uniref:Uncharacterized protein n=1 Tax=Ophiocordyceps polyrhachis-furcata BCC 54312 TaxID=1330021 RepID=A0A367LP64_9HYPO|nr:hypothetical protein L249_2802 [Ophiocordyceps polyrhachis-furcata BCC 54312]
MNMLCDGHQPEPTPTYDDGKKSRRAAIVSSQHKKMNPLKRTECHLNSITNPQTSEMSENPDQCTEGTKENLGSV